MTRAQSMDVINGSTTLQSRIDSVLSTPLMEWDYSPEIQWQPGDPLWEHPSKRTDIHQTTDEYGYPYSFSGGNYNRPMFQIIGRYERFVGMHGSRAIYDEHYGPDDTFESSIWIGKQIRCEDCQVGWGRDIDYCWMCGKSYPWPVRPTFKVDAHFENFQVGAGQAIGEVTEINDSINGLSVTYRFYDEYRHHLNHQQLTWLSMLGDHESNGMHFNSWSIASPRRSGRTLWRQWMLADETRADALEMVSINVLQENVDRIPPVPSLFEDIDLGLPSAEPEIVEVEIGDRIADYEALFVVPTVQLYIPAEIPTPQIILPERVLDCADTLVRPDLVEVRQYPTSNQITNLRRRRHI